MWVALVARALAEPTAPGATTPADQGEALPAPSAEVVDRVVAVVRGQPVLQSDLHLDELLADIDPSPIPFWTSGRPTQDIEIDAVIVRTVAADVSLYQPTHDQVAERL